MTDPNSDSARREPGDARPQYQPYLPYRPPGSDFTPPASPQPMNPFAAPPAKKSFGALRSKHPANVQTGAPVQSPHERQAYSPTPSSSPPLPPLPNSPHLPSRARAPSLLRHATTSSPLSEGYPQAGQPLPSPTFSMASDGVRRPGGRGLPSNPRAMFNPLASNPVHASGPGWNGPGEDIVGNPQARQRGYTSSSQPSYAHPPLRSATSIPDYGSVRDVDRTNLSGAYRPNRGGTNWSHADPHPPFRQFRGEEPRSSMRSGWTHASSFMGTNGTERGSFATGRSSISDPRISIVSGEQTDTQSVETDQGLTGDDDDDDEYPGMDIIDSYSAADVIESYFDTDEEKEESEQHNEKDSQHERASSSYSSDPDRRTSSGTHQQDIRRASRPDIESYPSRSSRERWDSRHVSDIDSGYYPSSRSQQTHHSISPLEPQVTGDGGFPSPQDDRRISALSESQGGEKSDFTSQRQSNGLPQLPPLDIGPTRISYSSTSDQNPQVAYNSPKERRDVREQGNETRGYPSTGERHDTLHSHPSAGAIQHSVEDSNVGKQPSMGGVGRSPADITSPRRQSSGASTQQRPEDIRIPSYRRPSETLSHGSPTGVYNPAALRRPSDTSSMRNREHQGHRRPSDTGSRKSPEMQGYHRPGSSKSTQSPPISPVDLVNTPAAWPKRGASKRTTLRKELLDMQQLPKLPVAKSRLSRQDWDNIQSYSKKYSTHGGAGPRTPLAVQIPAAKPSEPWADIKEEHVPRRNSADFLDRKSKLFDLGKPSPRPPMKSHTFGPQIPEDSEGPADALRNLEGASTSKQAFVAPASPAATSSPISPVSPTALPPMVPVKGVPRDRYGFKKQTQLISVKEYDQWYCRYQVHVDRRRQKWHALLKKHDLPFNAGSPPVRFPERCDKVKRYARKGYPPEWRGNMWWFYSSGPSVLSQMPGLYASLRARRDELGEIDRELIERDLHRTFPDNDLFKPDPKPTPDNPTGESDAEPQMIGDLREVLQCFALHYPNIGYCQSLNFIAGLLLLFLDGDCERVFVLLTVITQFHLPGAHARSLTNIEVNVLMMLVKDYLPKVWTAINDTDAINRGLGASSHPDSKFQRLPSVSISCTSWFMSLFVGALPIETVLRVWDAFLYEGPRALFRYALAVFKLGEPKLRMATPDSPELFQIVQNLPRGCIDPNILHDLAFVKKGFGGLTQGVVDEKRAFWRRENAAKTPAQGRLGDVGEDGGEKLDLLAERAGKEKVGLRRKASRRFLRKKD